MKNKYMENKLYGTRLYVDYRSINHNFNFLKKKINNSKVVVMVKANAYGHGDLQFTQYLESIGISHFAVADFEEGVRLRNAGVRGSIMVMNPGVNNLETIIENDLEPVIYNKMILSQMNSIIYKSSKKRVRIHIKFNTGMNRWGFNIEDTSYLINTISKNQNLVIGSIYSHFASVSDIEEDLFSQKQIDVLLNIGQQFFRGFKYNIDIHISNSAMILRDFHLEAFSCFRVGLLLYGGVDHPSLVPVSELKCPISDIRIVDIGDTIGYQRKYIVKQQKKIAIIPFGYADGLQRSWGEGKLRFYYQGQLIPTIGLISMDSCVLDITNIKDISIGDEVFYFGKKRPIWELAKELDTIPYEIMASLSRRIKRIYS